MASQAGAHRRKKEIVREFLNIRIPYADTLPRPQFGIEQEQVDAVHRIPRMQKVMD
jgi:hypothetical protein